MLSSYGKTLLMLREEDAACRLSPSQQSGGYARIEYNNFSGSVSFSAQNLSPNCEYQCFIYVSGAMPKYICRLKADKRGKGSAYGDFSFNNIKNCGQIAAVIVYVGDDAHLVLCGYKGTGMQNWREDVKHIALGKKGPKPLTEIYEHKYDASSLTDALFKSGDISSEFSEPIAKPTIQTENSAVDCKQNAATANEAAVDDEAPSMEASAEANVSVNKKRETKPDISDDNHQSSIEAVADADTNPGIYFDTVKDYFDEIFADYDEAQDTMREMIPNSRWQKVQYNGNDGYCLIGLILDYESNEPLYICYGVPGENSASVPGTLQNYCQWLPASSPGDGYWMMYQDAKTGETIVV